MSLAAAEPTTWQRARGYAVHAYTASGVGFGFAAAAELCSAQPSPLRFFLLNLAAVLVDSTDGPLARAWNVKQWAPAIDGRTIDDLVDYLTFTFLPLLLVWRMGWLPEPRLLWIVPALIASLFGFANTGAKDEGAGFFLGFPSYWNVVAFYAGIVHHFAGPWPNAAMLLLLALLTVLPVRFIYPNLAPRPWKVPLLAGAVVWLGMMIWMLVDYPSPPGWLVWLSLLYPAAYTALSVHLVRRGN